jgi:hypothetical protein
MADLKTVNSKSSVKDGTAWQGSMISDRLSMPSRYQGNRDQTELSVIGDHKKNHNIQYIEVEKPVIKERIVNKEIVEEVYVNVPEIREVIKPIYVPVPQEEIVEVYTLLPPPCIDVKPEYRKILAEGCVKLALFTEENKRLSRKLHDLEESKREQLEMLQKKGIVYNPNKKKRTSQNSKKVLTSATPKAFQQTSNHYNIQDLKVFQTSTDGSISRTEQKQLSSKVISENRGLATTTYIIQPPEPTLSCNSLKYYRDSSPPRTILPEYNDTRLRSRLDQISRTPSPGISQRNGAAVSQQITLMKPWTMTVVEKEEDALKGINRPEHPALNKYKFESAPQRAQIVNEKPISSTRSTTPGSIKRLENTPQSTNTQTLNIMASNLSFGKQFQTSQPSTQQRQPSTYSLQYHQAPTSQTVSSQPLKPMSHSVVYPSHTPTPTSTSTAAALRPSYQQHQSGHHDNYASMKSSVISTASHAQSHVVITSKRSDARMSTLNDDRHSLQRSESKVDMRSTMGTIAK